MIVKYDPSQKSQKDENIHLGRFTDKYISLLDYSTYKIS